MLSKRVNRKLVTVPLACPDLDGHEMHYLEQSMEAARLSHGPMVNACARELSKITGKPNVIMTASGTASLYMILQALVPPGKRREWRVIAPALTWPSSWTPARELGYRVEFCDVNSQWLMDVTRCARRHKSIYIPVHLFGMSADVGRIKAHCSNSFVIEDACEAIGNPDIGDGHVQFYSFYGNKVAAAGEGGAVTFDADLALDLWKASGYLPDRHITGNNWRMGELPGSVLLGQLQRLNRILKLRHHVWDQYDNLIVRKGWFEEVELLPQKRGAPWLYPVVFKTNVLREKALEVLRNKGVEARPFFYQTDKDYPNACRLSECGMLLPVHKYVTDGMVDMAVNAIDEVFSDG